MPDESGPTERVVSGHTAGQWRATYHEPGNTVQKGLAGYSIQTPAEGIAFNVCREANARLIAAAPDLLEALKEIAKGEGAYSRDPLTHAENVIEYQVSTAREAIAKAEASAD